MVRRPVLRANLLSLGNVTDEKQKCHERVEVEEP